MEKGKAIIVQCSNSFEEEPSLKSLLRLYEFSRVFGEFLK